MSEPGATSTTDGDVRWDPQDDQFIEDVVVLGVAAWAIGVAVLIAFLIYFMVRCICWICLNDECCDKRNKVRAPPIVVKWNNIVISLLLVICVAAGAWLLYAGTPIVESLDHLTGTMVSQINTFADNATDVIATVRTSLPPEANVNLTALDDADMQLADARETLIDVKSNVSDATDAFHAVVVAVGVGAILCAILGLLCVFVRKIVFLYLYFILGFFVVFDLWCLAGFGIIGNRAFTETCDMMRLHVAGDRNPTVVEELGCDDLAKGKPEVNNAVVSGNEAVASLNTDLESANSQLGLVNPSFEGLPLVCIPYVLNNATNQYETNNATQDCTPLRPDAVEQAYNASVCQADLPPNPDPFTNPAYQACLLDDPAQPITQQQYQDALNRSEGAVRLAGVLPFIYNVTDCAFVDNAFNVIIDEECDGLDSNSYGLASAAFIAAISLTLTTFYFCICIQNIRKQDAPQPAAGGNDKQFVT